MQEGQTDELSIPKVQAVRIEYPGYVKNVDAAISTLGVPTYVIVALSLNLTITKLAAPMEAMPCRRCARNGAGSFEHKHAYLLEVQTNRHNVPPSHCWQDSCSRPLGGMLQG